MGELGDMNNDNEAIREEINLTILLRHLSNFWRSLNMPLINCKIELQIGLQTV